MDRNSSGAEDGVAADEGNEGDRACGRRRDGKPFKEGNTAPDGSYIRGKCRPPVEGRFTPGDGRKRGRRTKGTKNLKTDFAEEMARLVSVRENGQVVRVSQQRLMVKQLCSNAGKGQNRAIELAFVYYQRLLGETPDEAAVAMSLPDQAIVDAYILRRASVLDDADLGPVEDRSSPATDDAVVPPDHRNDDGSDDGGS